MRTKKQGEYRLKKAMMELEILVCTIQDSDLDDIDKNEALTEIDETRWLIKEGLQDLLEGK